MTRTLLITANSAMAALYSLQGLKIEQLIKTLTAKTTIFLHHPSGHRDNFYKKASTQSHLLDPHQEAKQINRKNFSKVIANEILELHPTESFNSLLIVAESKVLGDLRKYLQKSSLKIVCKEVSENLCHLSKPQLEKHLESIFTERRIKTASFRA